MGRTAIWLKRTQLGGPLGILRGKTDSRLVGAWESHRNQGTHELESMESCKILFDPFCIYYVILLYLFILYIDYIVIIKFAFFLMFRSPRSLGRDVPARSDHSCEDALG